MMDKDYAPNNNDLLAEWYQAHTSQVIVVYPYVWKHFPGGDWFERWDFRNGAFVLSVNESA